MSSLRSFLITRILLIIPMIMLILTIVFVLIRVIPGDPIRAISPKIPESQVQSIREELGLNRPIWEQYIDFLLRIITLDFGTSIRTNGDVGSEVRLAFGVTIQLGLAGVLLGVPLGIVLGGYAGANREKIPDHIVRLFTIGVYSIPIFLLGILFQIVFSYIIPILPPLDLMRAGATAQFTRYTDIWIIDTLLSGRPDLTLDILIHLIMPSTCLALLTGSTIARQVRAHMIDQLEQDYVQFTRSRGIREKNVVYKDTLKNAVIPTIGLIGLMFALLLAGAILTETTFNIPGLGRYLFQAIANRDFPAVQGGIVILAMVVAVMSLLSDVTYGLLDPRVRF